MKIALDKQAHFLSGAVIVFALYTAGFGPLVYAIACGLAGALGKSIYTLRARWPRLMLTGQSGVR